MIAGALGSLGDMPPREGPPGGVVAVDNVLWHGKVLSDKPDKSTKVIKTLNKKIKMKGLSKS